jgi:hypothetical protein
MAQKAHNLYLRLVPLNYFLLGSIFLLSFFQKPPWCNNEYDVTFQFYAKGSMLLSIKRKRYNFAKIRPSFDLKHLVLSLRNSAFSGFSLAFLTEVQIPH